MMAVDGLNHLQDTECKESGNFSILLEETLQKYKEESTASLDMVILHHDKKEDKTLVFM